MAANVKSLIKRLSHEEVLALLEQGVRVYNSPDSPIAGPIPDVFVQPAVVQRVYDGFKVAHEAAQSRETQKVDARNALRPPFNETMVNFIDFVELASRNNPSLIYTFGLGFIRAGGAAKSSGKSSQVPIPVLTLQAIDKEPGSIYGKVRGGVRKGIEIQHAYEDPSQEASWMHFDSFGKGSFCMTGLTSGRRTYVRARFITSNGKGPWSDLISIMVP